MPPTHTLLTQVEWLGQSHQSINNVCLFSGCFFPSMQGIQYPSIPLSCRLGLLQTGRFGIGFNSVYHVTDVPSFVSKPRSSLKSCHPTFLIQPDDSRSQNKNASTRTLTILKTDQPMREMRVPLHASHSYQTRPPLNATTSHHKRYPPSSHHEGSLACFISIRQLFGLITEPYKVVNYRRTSFSSIYLSSF